MRCIGVGKSKFTQQTKKRLSKMLQIQCTTQCYKHLRIALSLPAEREGTAAVDGVGLQSDPYGRTFRSIFVRCSTEPSSPYS